MRKKEKEIYGNSDTGKMDRKNVEKEQIHKLEKRE